MRADEAKKLAQKEARAAKKNLSPESTTVRLNKFIADSGICSRRKADELIADGQVKLNGKPVFELGLQIDTTMDSVSVNGETLKRNNKFVYYIVNKPKKFVTSMSDPLGRPTIADIIDGGSARIFPIGRLDWETEGLLIMTNDGAFSQKVSHPKEEIPKTYLAKVDGKPGTKQLKKLLSGVTIPGGKVAAKAIERLDKGSSKQYEWIKIIITEGKNRQVHRMFEKIGFDVLKLQRVAIGQLKLGALKKGEYRKLTGNDLEKVFKPLNYFTNIEPIGED